MNTALHRQLEALGEDYTYRVNTLIEEGREHLAESLSAEYDRERASLLRRAS